MMTANYSPLKIAPYWQMTNDNLIDLMELVPEEKLDWTPAPGEWSTRVILTHIILARYHDQIVPGREGAEISEVVMDCRTKEGLKKHLASSWQMVAEFLSDPAKLDATHEPLTASAPEYIRASRKRRPLHRLPPDGARHSPPLDDHRPPEPARDQPGRSPRAPAVS